MLEELYQACGLLASFIGTFVEGEVLLLTSVISAKMGMFNYYWGLIAAFFGAYVKDWLKFIVVKKQGNKLLDKKPKLKQKIDKSSVWFDKRPFFILSVYRLMYGMGTIIILMSGIKNISYLRFGIHSAISIALWIIVFGGFGWFCAEAMLSGINNLTDYKWYILGTLIVIGIVVWYYRHRPHDKYCLTPHPDA